MAFRRIASFVVGGKQNGAWLTHYPGIRGSEKWLRIPGLQIPAREKKAD